MHKYQPRVHIIKKKDHTASLLNLKSEEFRTFVFVETVFTAVTAYQNQLVSKLSQITTLCLCLSSFICSGAFEFLTETLSGQELCINWDQTCDLNQRVAILKW